MFSTPEFLAIGHVTRDLQPDGSFTLGGTTTYAATTASRLGLAAGIVTCADTQLCAELPELLPDIALHTRSTTATTTFTNRYIQEYRTQYLHALSDPLMLSDIPASWSDASIILLGPLAQELNFPFVSSLQHEPGTLLAATPQGWLRRWDETGRVWPAAWHEAEQILPLLDALILSHDDLLSVTANNSAEVDMLLTRWSRLVPLLITTDGQYGSVLFKNGKKSHFSAYPVCEVDPTGAGDVFAAAFLVSLARNKDPEYAVNFANCTASFSVEQTGVHGIPTLAMVEQRLHHCNR